MRKLAGKVAIGMLGAIALGVAGLLGAAFLPTLLGAESLIVTSGSMGRAMPVGSVAITRLVDSDAIAVGDMISFRNPGVSSTVTHRVVAVREEAGGRLFVTKGDANPAPDPEPVRVNDRIHRVDRVVPYAGWVVRYARSPAGLVIFFVVPILGLTFERRRAAAKKATVVEEHIDPSAVPPEPPAAQPSPVVAAVIGAVAGGIAAGALLRASDRSARHRRWIGS